MEFLNHSFGGHSEITAVNIGEKGVETDGQVGGQFGCCGPILLA
jgi:hypothetical protein